MRAGGVLGIGVAGVAFGFADEGVGVADFGELGVFVGVAGVLVPPPLPPRQAEPENRGPVGAGRAEGRVGTQNTIWSPCHS